MAEDAAPMPPALLQRWPGLGWSLAVAMLVVVLFVAFAVGKFPVAPTDLWQSVQARLLGTASGLPPAVDTVVWNIRMPRVLAGLLVGAALAAAGAVYQGMFRNPLVSPDILGVSAGAGLGAVIGIFIGLPLALVQVLAFAGGLLAVGAVLAVSALVRRQDPVLVLVLTGVAVGSLLGGGISLLKLLADSSTQLPTITFWLLGALNAVSPRDLAATAPALLAGLVPMALLRWRVNLLSLADEEALALGVPVTRLRLVLVAAATLSTAAAVSLTGIIGWVGLVVPHVARLWVGPEFSRLLPASLLLGGGFLVATDTLARTLAPIELPLGVLTAFVGVPFFIWVLARAGGRE